MRLDLHIPHLGFAVYVRPRPKDWRAYASTLFSKDGYSVKLVLPDNCSTAGLAHELVHVLQAICQRYTIAFEHEREHTAYIMQWLMEAIQQAQRAKKGGGPRNEPATRKPSKKMQGVRGASRSNKKVYGRLITMGAKPVWEAALNETGANCCRYATYPGEARDARLTK